MWIRYNGEVFRAQQSIRSAEQSILKFDEHTWYVNDENRDRVVTYSELTGFGQKSAAEADELYAVVGKDPTQEALTYEEVLAVYQNSNYMDKEGFIRGWRSFSQGSNVDIAGIDTTSQSMI